MASAARSSFEFSSENAKIADWPVLSAAKPTIQFYKISGSVDPADLRARYRTPVEVGWHRMCKFDHDFVGRAALEAEVAHGGDP